MTRVMEGGLHLLVVGQLARRHVGVALERGQRGELGIGQLRR